MENLVWLIYLIDVAPSFKVSFPYFPFTLIGIVGTLSLLVYSGYYSETTVNQREQLKTPYYLAGKVCKIYLSLVAVFAFCSIVTSAIPDRDTSYKMLAAYGISELSQIEGVKSVASESVKLLENTLRDYNLQFENKEVIKNDQQN